MHSLIIVEISIIDLTLIWKKLGWNVKEDNRNRIRSGWKFVIIILSESVVVLLTASICKIGQFIDNCPPLLLHWRSSQKLLSTTTSSLFFEKLSFFHSRFAIKSISIVALVYWLWSSVEGREDLDLRPAQPRVSLSLGSIFRRATVARKIWPPKSNWGGLSDWSEKRSSFLWRLRRE